VSALLASRVLPGSLVRLVLALKAQRASKVSASLVLLASVILAHRATQVCKAILEFKAKRDLLAGLPATPGNKEFKARQACKVRRAHKVRLGLASKVLQVQRVQRDYQAVQA
jgi:hypothetical protein